MKNLDLNSSILFRLTPKSERPIREADRTCRFSPVVKIELDVINKTEKSGSEFCVDVKVQIRTIFDRFIP